MDTANQDIANAPLPTEATLRSRNSVVMQAWRFASINLRMLKIVRKGHG